MWMRIRILRAAVSGSRHTRCKASLIAHTGAGQHQHVSACVCMSVRVRACIGLSAKRIMWSMDFNCC